MFVRPKLRMDQWPRGCAPWWEAELGLSTGASARRSTITLFSMALSENSSQTSQMATLSWGFDRLLV